MFSKDLVKEDHEVNSGKHNIEKRSRKQLWGYCCKGIRPCSTAACSTGTWRDIANEVAVKRVRDEITGGNQRDSFPTFATFAGQSFTFYRGGNVRPTRCNTASRTPLSHFSPGSRFARVIINITHRHSRFRHPYSFVLC